MRPFPRRPGTEPETIAEWRVYAETVKSSSRWRREALRAMYAVIVTNPWKKPGELKKLVDAAYPFDMRKHHPYKLWLRERTRLLIAIGDTKKHPDPTAEDVAACEVATDLVELGKVDEAKALLDAQAPNRHNRVCPTCGARIGKPCKVFTKTWEVGKLRPELVVPHTARVALPSGDGPLFARSA